MLQDVQDFAPNLSHQPRRYLLPKDVEWDIGKKVGMLKHV